MATNRVFVEKTNETVFLSDTLSESVNWLMARKDQYDIHTTYIDEVDEDGNVLGWWSLDDLICELEMERRI